MKKIPSNLLHHFLQNNPLRVAQRLSAFLPYVQLQTKGLPTDEQFIQQFLFNVNCQYLLNKHFLSPHHYPSKAFEKMKFDRGMVNFPNEKGKKSPMETKILQNLKNLNDHKSMLNFIETLEVVQLMSAEEAHLYKKYLIYIYKWSINQGDRIPQPTRQFNSELKETVVKKIYEGHSKAEQAKNVQEQLKRIQTLARARQGIAKGDNDLAKINYQAIFEDDKNDHNTRMEALEYLCRESAEKGDEGYLLGMMNKIQGNKKEEHHRKYILSTLQQINKSGLGKSEIQPEKNND